MSVKFEAMHSYPPGIEALDVMITTTRSAEKKLEAQSRDAHLATPKDGYMRGGH